MLKRSLAKVPLRLTIVVFQQQYTLFRQVGASGIELHLSFADTHVTLNVSFARTKSVSLIT
jgi:hypothetical protein